jgi:hypothetical protein
MIHAARRLLPALVLWLLAMPVAAASAPDPAELDAAPDSTANGEEEDLPRYRVVDPIRSESTEMTLREIIARAVRGEETKLEGHHDMTFNVTFRSVLLWEKKKEVRDQIYLVYQDDRGLDKRVLLTEQVSRYKRKDGAWVADPEQEEGGEVRVEVERDSPGGTLSRLPFFLENQEDYRFTLRERTLEGDHVIFGIEFQPRSRFKPLPSGVVYIDTDAFRVIHEEFRFDENPVPLFLKGVDRVSRQWTHMSRGEWVTSRILGSFRLNGAFGVMPDRVDVALIFNDYRFDQGYDPERFGPHGER